MYSFQGHLKDGRTFTVQHHEESPTVETLKRVAEQTVSGVAAHMIIKFVSKGRAK